MYEILFSCILRKFSLRTSLWSIRSIGSIRIGCLQANPSIGWNIKIGTISPARDAESETRQSVNKVAKVIIRFNADSVQQNRNRSGSSVTKSDLGDEFEIVSEETKEDQRLTLPNSLKISTTNQEASNSSQMANRLLAIDERDPNGKSISNRILGIAYDKIVSHGISEKKDLATLEESASRSISEEENHYAERKDIDFMKNKLRLTTSSPAREKPVTSDVLMSDSFWRRKDEAQLSHRVSAGGAAMAVAMITIGTIMLLLGPAVIVLRLLDKRRQARKSQNELSDDATWQEDLPPSYEQVVLMNEETPRYSSLGLNARVDNDLHLSSFSLSLSRSPSPSPSPSPLPPTSFSPTHGSSLSPSAIKSHSCR